MDSIKEIGKIFEIRCPCGKNFTVDAVERIYVELAKAGETTIGEITYSTVTCPRCKRNSFNFLFKHVKIRKDHPLLWSTTSEKCRKKLAELAGWST